MRLSIIATKFHKWLGLLVGIQIILWVAGGLVMSWFPIEDVRGEHNVAHHDPVPLAAGENFVQFDDILAAEPDQAIKDMTLRRLGDQPVYAARYIDGTQSLFDALTGQKLSPVPEQTALEVAKADFAGESDVPSIDLLDNQTTEYRGPVPVWRIYLNDNEDTRIYVSPDTARVVARRNATWRFYDFFWMLHIMDYDERSDFNHPLLIIASVVALIVSISGAILIFYRFKRRDFKWILPK